MLCINDESEGARMYLCKLCMYVDRASMYVCMYCCMYEIHS